MQITDGAPVEIYDYSGNLIFSGFINYPRVTNPIGTDALFFDIEAIDQHELADRYLVAEAFVNQTAGYIVNTILTNYLAADGVTVGNIEAGITLDVAKFPRANTVAEVLDNLAEICGFVWFIDFDKKLYFQERNATVAGFNLTDTSRILNINVRNDRSKYRNRQYIRGGQTPVS